MKLTQEKVRYLKSVGFTPSIEEIKKKFGRIPAIDPRDKNYPMSAVMKKVPSAYKDSRYWNAEGYWSNQGNLPHCVAHGWLHIIEDGPVTHKEPAPIINTVDMYNWCQENDEIPGINYDGTTSRAGAEYLKIIKQIISEYRWGSSAEEIMEYILGTGPVGMGTGWHSSMVFPDKKGKVTLNGEVEGGHFWKLDGGNRKTKLFRGKNSWGRDWGKTGFFYISMNDLDDLLKDFGEACIATELKTAS